EPRLRGKAGAEHATIWLPLIPPGVSRYPPEDGVKMEIAVVSQKLTHLVRLVRFAIVVAVVAPALAQTLAWERAVGSTHGGDYGYGAAVDATGVYVVGMVPFGNALPGQT